MRFFGHRKKTVDPGEFVCASHSPGYGDMLGASYSESLRKNENGEWTFVRREREHHSAPTVVTTYAVSVEAVEAFVSFLEEKNVLALQDRPDDNIFITDYHPWGYSFDFRREKNGRRELEFYNISQNKEYSAADHELLNELSDVFQGLCGDVISVKKEKPER